MPLSGRGLPEIDKRIMRMVGTMKATKRPKAMLLRDELGEKYSDEGFAHLFPQAEAPAEEPWRLAWITMFQAMEDLTDIQAASFVIQRMDWKYALSLPIDEAEFHLEVLAKFRARLKANAEEADLVLQPLVEVAQEKKWLQPLGKVRLSAMAVLEKVQILANMGIVMEVMREELPQLAQVVPEDMLDELQDEWFDEYVFRSELKQLPVSEQQKGDLRLHVGEDFRRLLQFCEGRGMPEEIQKEESVLKLKEVFDRYYEVEQGKVKWREGWR